MIAGESSDKVDIYLVLHLSRDSNVLAKTV